MAIKEYDLAIRDLETVVDTGFPGASMVHFFSEHPQFDAIRDHPMFEDLVRRAGLPIRPGGD